MRRLTTIVLVAAMFATNVASADDAELRAAKKFYARGQKLFNLQKFDQALEQFQKAYEAKPIPDFLFNIGQCQRNLEDFEAAAFSFKQYLKLDPTTPRREAVEQLIEQLETKIAARKSEQLKVIKEPPPPPRPQPDKPSVVERRDESRPLYKKWWFWTGLAVVGAGAGVGIYAATAKDGLPATDLGHAVFPK